MELLVPLSKYRGTPTKGAGPGSLTLSSCGSHREGEGGVGYTGSCQAPKSAPAEAGDSPGPAAEAGQATAPGSAESLAAYSGTGAGPAGTPGGSLPLARGRHVVRPEAGLPETYLDSRHPTCTPPNSLTCFCGRLLRYLALLDRTVFWLGTPRNSLSGVLFSSKAQTTRCLPPMCSALAGNR